MGVALDFYAVVMNIKDMLREASNRSHDLDWG